MSSLLSLSSLSPSFINRDRKRTQTTQLKPVHHLMSTTIFLCASSIILLSSSTVYGFPDGAPGGETCVKHRPNHGARSQPLSTLPYIVKASSGEYENGTTIAVQIIGKPGVYFKGFFVQAADDQGRWIGRFEPTPFSVSHPECSMITHHDNEEKEEVTLIWVPPSQPPKGSVRFMTSILKNYKVFWVDAVATAPAKSSSSSS